MLTYTGSRNLFGQLTNNIDSTHLTNNGDLLINQAIKKLVNFRNWSFREGTATLSSVASQQAYRLPNDISKLKSLTYTVSSFVYTPMEITTKQEWEYINKVSITSDFPKYYYIFDGQVQLYPIPASSSKTITLTYSKKVKDLAIPDYTTGTITTATNGDETIIGSGTTFTAQMAGFALKITGTSTVNTGDNVWYKISSITNATTLELVNKYQGNSISAGSATYTIGETSIIPEEYQELPVYRACEVYFTTLQPEPTRAQMFKRLYDEGLAEMMGAENKSGDPVVSVYGKPIINPNNYVLL